MCGKSLVLICSLLVLSPFLSSGFAQEAPSPKTTILNSLTSMQEIIVQKISLINQQSKDAETLKFLVMTLRDDLETTTSELGSRILSLSERLEISRMDFETMQKDFKESSQESIKLKSSLSRSQRLNIVLASTSVVFGGAFVLALILH